MAWPQSLYLYVLYALVSAAMAGKTKAQKKETAVAPKQASNTSAKGQCPHIVLRMVANCYAYFHNWSRVFIAFNQLTEQHSFNTFLFTQLGLF